MATTHETELHILSPEASGELFERETQRLLGIPAAEFLQRYDAGGYDAEIDTPRIIRLVMLLPLVR
ncbi:MAG: hypothetical protein QOF51_3508 [Chloroflexota bacterium]|nr:hypothetical protein [Chloroflexota bacterium]